MRPDGAGPLPAEPLAPGPVEPPGPPERSEGPPVRRAKHARFLATLEQTKQGLPPEPDPDAAPDADEHLLLVPATLPQRLLAGAIDALVVSATAGGGALLLTLLVWGPLLGTDFAGSAQRKALAEWLLLANSLALALLYTFAQALGRPTAGDRAVGLRLVPAVEPPGLLCDSPPPPDAPPERQGWRFRLRWALANLPLIGMTLLCAAGALRTHVLGLYAFDAIRTHGGSHPDRHLALAGVLLLLYWPAAYLWAWADDGQPLWDRLSRIHLQRPATPLAIREQGRGFDVVPPRAGSAGAE